MNKSTRVEYVTVGGESCSTSLRRAEAGKQRSLVPDRNFGQL